MNKKYKKQCTKIDKAHYDIVQLINFFRAEILTEEYKEADSLYAEFAYTIGLSKDNVKKLGPLFWNNMGNYQAILGLLTHIEKTRISFDKKFKKFSNKMFTIKYCNEDKVIEDVIPENLDINDFYEAIHKKYILKSVHTAVVNTYDNVEEEANAN